MWERGLKQKLDEEMRHHRYVAPYAGAWIESSLMLTEFSCTLVAPYAEHGLKQERSSTEGDHGVGSTDHFFL